MNHFSQIEMARNPRGSAAPPAIKTALRLARKLRARKIDANFLSLLFDGESVNIEVGRRVVRVTEEGDIVQDFRPQHTRMGWRADPQGMGALHRRQHARYLMWAKACRRTRSYREARIMIDSARFDRLYCQ